MLEETIWPGNKNNHKLHNTCVYLNRILFGADNLNDLFSDEGKEDCYEDHKYNDLSEMR